MLPAKSCSAHRVRRYRSARLRIFPKFVSVRFSAIRFFKIFSARFTCFKAVINIFVEIRNLRFRRNDINRSEDVHLRQAVCYVRVVLSHHAASRVELVNFLKQKLDSNKPVGHWQLSRLIFGETAYRSTKDCVWQFRSGDAVGQIGAL